VLLLNEYLSLLLLLFISLWLSPETFGYTLVFVSAMSMILRNYLYWESSPLYWQFYKWGKSETVEKPQEGILLAGIWKLNASVFPNSIQLAFHIIQVSASLCLHSYLKPHFHWNNPGQPRVSRDVTCTRATPCDPFLCWGHCPDYTCTTLRWILEGPNYGSCWPRCTIHTPARAIQKFGLYSIHHFSCFWRCEDFP